MTIGSPFHDEFYSVARQAITAAGADSALKIMGWWDLLAGFDDHEQRIAAFAFLRAQGNTLTSSVALGGLLAYPFISGTDFAAGDVIATIRRVSHGTVVHTVVGDPTGRRLLIDRPGHGAAIVDAADVQLHPIAIPGRLVLAQVHSQSADCELSIPEAAAATARLRSMFLGRLGAAAEILGSAERTLELAVDYVAVREQFGRPIGTFQAIRHLLSWSLTDCVAADAVIRQAIRLDESAPTNLGAIAKAIAGRNGRRVCDRTLQALGGIGFTAEHEHHHFHSRVLALDAMLGSSAELISQLGVDLRRSDGSPEFATAVLNHRN